MCSKSLLGERPHLTLQPKSLRRRRIERQDALIGEPRLAGATLSTKEIGVDRVIGQEGFER